MLKLRLEEIAIREAQRRVQSSLQQGGQEAKSFLIELDKETIVHIRLERRDINRQLVFRGNPLNDVGYYESRYPECTHVYLKIDDRSIPSRQGTFRHNEAGVLLYENECHHGTLLIPANATEQNQNPIYGEYPAKPGDQFLLGFPRSMHRFKAIIIEN